MGSPSSRFLLYVVPDELLSGFGRSLCEITQSSMKYLHRDIFIQVVPVNPKDG